MPMDLLLFARRWERGGEEREGGEELRPNDGNTGTRTADRSKIVKRRGRDLTRCGTSVPQVHYFFVLKKRPSHFGFVSISLGFEFFGLGEGWAHKDGRERGG